MAYTLNGERVSQAVTVKVYIQDTAVKFYAKYAQMGIREARKEMTQRVLGYGDDNALEVYYSHGDARIGRVTGEDLDAPDFELYDGGSFNWFSMEVQ